MKIPAHIPKGIEKLHTKHQFRQLSDCLGIDFISNDYLGLAQSPRTVYSYFGSGGARLLSGNSQAHVALEQWMGDWFQASALLFNSGYTANIGVLSTLPSRRAIVFYDEEIHASCKEGLRLSLAQKVAFKHNNLAHLIEKINLFPAQERYILVESVYSMSGDKAPLTEIANICREKNIYLIVDEAHSLGIWGEQGKGLAYPFSDVCVALVFPLGKSVGTSGALVVCPEETKHYLINHARAWIYSTAMPPALAEVSLDNLKQLALADESRKQLQERMSLFSSHSAIITVKYSGNEQVKSLSKYLNQMGFALKPILSPTVPAGEERIRIVLHTFNTREEILSLQNHIAYFVQTNTQ